MSDSMKRSIEDLQSVFADTLGLLNNEKIQDLAYRENAAWDSMAHMSLVAAIEDAFGVMLPTEDILDLSSFNRAREILEKHGVCWDA